MVAKKFSQRKFVGKRNFELSEKDVSVNEAHFFSHRKYKIPLELLGNNRFEIKTYSKRLAWGTVITGILSLICFVMWITNSKAVGLDAPIFWGTISLVAGWFLYLSWQKWIVYGGEDASIDFYADVPSKEQVDAFIADVEQCKKEYLLQKYSYAADSNSIADQLLKLTWLKNNGALSEEEFERIKQRLVDGFEIDGNFSL